MDWLVFLHLNGSPSTHFFVFITPDIAAPSVPFLFKGFSLFEWMDHYREQIFKDVVLDALRNRAVFARDDHCAGMTGTGNGNDDGR